MGAVLDTAEIQQHSQPIGYVDMPIIRFLWVIDKVFDTRQDLTSPINTCSYQQSAMLWLQRSDRLDIHQFP